MDLFIFSLLLDTCYHCNNPLLHLNIISLIRLRGSNLSFTGCWSVLLILGFRASGSCISCLAALFLGLLFCLLQCFCRSRQPRMCPYLLLLPPRICHWVVTSFVHANYYLLLCCCYLLLIICWCLYYHGCLKLLCLCSLCCSCLNGYRYLMKYSIHDLVMFLGILACQFRVLSFLLCMVY